MGNINKGVFEQPTPKRNVVGIVVLCIPGQWLCHPISGIQESGKVLLVKYTKNNLESWALESGILLKEYGIPLTIVIKNPSSTDLKSRIQNIRLSRIFLHGASFA